MGSQRACGDDAANIDAYKKAIALRCRSEFFDATCDVIQTLSSSVLKMLSKSASYLIAAVLASVVRSAPAPLSLDRRTIDDPFAVLDQQNWVNPDDMTWDDFVPPPGTDWSDPTQAGSIRNFRIALVAVDYPDENFTITKPVGSTPFNNPQPDASELAREDVPAFYRDLLNRPQALNRNHTLHEYWMEDSAGRYVA